MHLFASFVMRAFMALLKDMLFVPGMVGLADSVIEDNEGYWLVNKKDIGEWHCKMFTSLWQYFLLANYSWILMEGIYLHNLIFLALFTDANSSIAGYVAFGWGTFNIKEVIINSNSFEKTYSTSSDFIYLKNFNYFALFNY